MKKRFKNLIAILLTLSLILSVNMVSFANEDNNEGKVKVTNELILQMAERFSEIANPDLNLTAKNPVKFYDTNDKAIGYIVSYYSGNKERGYIIFDTTQEALISEYSFDEAAKTPVETVKARAKGISLNDRVYKTAPFTYGCKEDATNVILNNYGETENVPSTHSSNKPEWNDIFMEIKDIYENYTPISIKTIPEFISFDEFEEIEAKTGCYACTVTALYACAYYYGAASYSNMKADYLKLWDLSKTEVDHVSGDITYGATYAEHGGPALRSFCSSKGKTVEYRHINSPNYSFFTKCIDRGDIAIYSAGLNTSSGRAGHSLTVEGYASYLKNSSGKRVNTVLVYDGWNTYVRYLNIDYNFMDSTGTEYFG